MIIKAYAKINLALSVEGVRDDGYHDLDMVSVPVGIYDTVEIETVNTFGRATIACYNPNVFIDDESQVRLAINIMREHFNIATKFDVNIKKGIPLDSGMGGESADAAAIMMGICKLCKLKPSLAELMKLGAQVGCDVPFFLVGKPARVRGKGEIIEPFKLKKKYSVLVVKPNYGCHTKEIFSLYKEKDHLNLGVRTLVHALEDGDDLAICSLVGNDLEAAASSKVMEISSYKEQFKKSGASFAYGMTGSGSALYALSTNEKLLDNLSKLFGRKPSFIQIAEVLNEY